MTTLKTELSLKTKLFLALDEIEMLKESLKLEKARADNAEARNESLNRELQAWLPKIHPPVFHPKSQPEVERRR